MKRKEKKKIYIQESFCSKTILANRLSMFILFMQGFVKRLDINFALWQKTLRTQRIWIISFLCNQAKNQLQRALEEAVKRDSRYSSIKKLWNRFKFFQTISLSLFSFHSRLETVCCFLRYSKYEHDSWIKYFYFSSNSIGINR